MNEQNNTINPNIPEEKGKVIKGTAQIDKPKLSKRIVDILFSDRIDSMFLYLGQQILGPTLRKLAYDLGNGALQMALFGGNNGGWTPGGSYVPGYGYQPARKDPVPYNNMYQGNPGGYNYGYAQPQPSIFTPRVSLNEVSFTTKDDALLILDRMWRELQRYHRVRVADFYEYSGITGQEGNWAISGTGWYDLTGAKPIMRTDGRWIIDFPPAVALR